MKLLSCALVAFVLSGCALCPPKVVTVPVEVKVPVPVRCKVAFPVAPVPITAAPLPDGLYGKGVRIISEGDDYRLYAKELEAALSKCADPDMK